MSAAMSAADRPETGSPEWHSFHHAGEGQHHECDYDVCVEWSARQAPTPRPAMTVATLRKTTEIEPGWHGTVVYRVLVDGRRIGWVGDQREFNGWRFGSRKWWACWREDGDTSARWRSQDADATSTRQAAVDALVSRAAEGVAR